MGTDVKWSSLSKTIAISDARSIDFNKLTVMKSKFKIIIVYIHVCICNSEQSKISLKVFNDDPLAKQLWKGESGTELNPIQQDSIKRALTNSFQLIQGPPGNENYRPIRIKLSHLSTIM